MKGFLSVVLLGIVMRITSGYEPAGDRSSAATLIASLSHSVGRQSASSADQHPLSSAASSKRADGAVGQQAVLSTQSAASQRFLVEPTSATVLRQSNVTFRCTVALHIGSVLWLKDGFSLSKDRTVYLGYSQYRITGDENAGEYHLTIPAVELQDEGRFYCQVSGLKKPLVSTKAELSVLIPPQVVTIHPANYTAFIANRIWELQCSAISSKPAANVSWLPDTSLRVLNITQETIFNDTNKLLSTTSSLRLIPNDNDHGKIVSCLVHGESLREPILVSTMLNIVFPPVVIASMFPKQAVMEGELLTMKCAAHANPPVTWWSWFLNSELILNSTSDIFVIDSVSRSLNGRQMSCVASNEYGVANASQTIHVRFPPTFKSERRIEQTDVQGTAVLSCEVESSPEAIITWKKVIETTVNGTVKRMLRDVPNGGTKKLLFKNVTLSDFGEYVCVADAQNLFPVGSASFYLLRRQPPTITNRGQVFLASRYARNVQLVCSVLSVPRPKAVIWTKDGRELNDYRNVHRDDFVGGEHAYLLLEEMNSDSFGDYNCSVVNMLGADSAIIHLRLKNHSDVYILTSCIAGLCILLIILTLLCIIGIYKRHVKSRTPRHSTACPAVAEKQDSAIPSPLVTSIHSAQHCIIHNGDRVPLRVHPIDKTDLVYSCTHLPPVENGHVCVEQNATWKPPVKEQQSYVGYKEDDFSLMNVSLNNYCLQDGLRSDGGTQQANTVSPLASSSGYSSGSVGASNHIGGNAQPPNTPECNTARQNGSCKFTIQSVGTNGDSPHCVMHQLGGCSFIMATDAPELHDRNSCVMTVLTNPLVVQPVQTLRSDCTVNPAVRRSRILNEAHSCFEQVSTSLIRENATIPTTPAALRCIKQDDKSKKCFYTEL